jgi:DNA primase
MEIVPFNLQILNTLNKNDILVITEGITDCISCNLMGKNAVGILGANGFKKEYLEYLKDFDIYVIPDNDCSGQTFYNKIREQFVSIGKTVDVRFLRDKYKDISEYYMETVINEQNN